MSDRAAGTPRAPILATALLLAALGPMPVRAAGITVTRQGFCLARSETGCAEVVIPGTSVDSRRLPKDRNGTPAILFFSVQKAKAGTFFAHVLEAEDAEPRIVQGLADGTDQPLSDSGRVWKTLSAKLRGVGHVLITLFRADAGQPDVPMYSVLTVTGPGAFAGRVVDANGAAVPGSDRITFNIFRNPD